MLAIEQSTLRASGEWGVLEGGAGRAASGVQGRWQHGAEQETKQ
jgi:hypothetical protein